MLVVAHPRVVVVTEQGADQVAAAVHAGLREDAFEVLLHGDRSEHELDEADVAVPQIPGNPLRRVEGL
jgi:hypothetical protein